MRWIVLALWLLLTPIWISYSSSAGSGSKVAFIPPALVLIVFLFHWLWRRLVVRIAGEFEPRRGGNVQQLASRDSLELRRKGTFHPIWGLALPSRGILRVALLAAAVGACAGVVVGQSTFDAAVFNSGTAVPTRQANLPTSGHPLAVEKQSFSAAPKIAAVSEPNPAMVKTEAVKPHAFSAASKTQDRSAVTSSNNLAKRAEAQTSIDGRRSPDLPPAAARQGQRDFPVNVPPDWSVAPGKSNEWRAFSPRRNAWLSLYATPVLSGSSDLDRGAVTAGDRVTYQQRGRGWNVVSGYTADNRIFYRKTMLACGGRKWHKLEFEYPASDKRAMDGFVTRASHALGAYSSAGC
jgi:hypothetical protein